MTVTGEHRDDSSRGKRGRGGRPPVDRAGEVNTRILDAASDLFMARGLEGTSCDQIAARARAGKASIYARYANKQALFAAVVKREVERSLAATHHAAASLPVRGRLIAVGTSIIKQSLRPRSVALMRLIIAEAARFPELASQVDAIGRDGGVRRVAEVIACRHISSSEALERAMPLAAAFIEFVFVPHQMRALLGDDLATLQAGAEREVEAKTTMLIAAGLLDGWR